MSSRGNAKRSCSTRIKSRCGQSLECLPRSRLKAQLLSIRSWEAVPLWQPLETWADEQSESRLKSTTAKLRCSVLRNVSLISSRPALTQPWRPSPCFLRHLTRMTKDGRHDREQNRVLSPESKAGRRILASFEGAPLKRDQWQGPRRKTSALLSIGPASTD